MKIRIGTNRFVIILKNYVLKIPISFRGLLANDMEYNYSIERDYVAKTSKRWYGLKQERLFNTQTFIQGTTEEELPDCLKYLYKYKLTNRIQIGRNKQGQWKFFDYEDIKYYQGLYKNNKLGAKYEKDTHY